MIFRNIFKTRLDSKNYFICTVQRSGKSWLCNLLTKMQNYGAPEEYLLQSSLENKFGDEAALRSILSDNNISELRDYVREITLRKTGSSDILGLAIQESQINNLARIADVSTIRIFEKLYRRFDHPKIFFLRRNDMAEQAVSHFFMAQTGIAHSYQPGSNKDETYVNVKYDQKEILRWYKFTINGYNFWESIFKQAGVKFENVFYEDLREDLYSNVTKITNMINSDFNITKKQLELLLDSGHKKLTLKKKKQYVDKFKTYILDLEA